MKMIDDFESHKARSSRDLWSEICWSLPDVQVQEEDQGQGEDNAALFKDSFQPSHVGNDLQSNGMSMSFSSHSVWEPMEDSDVYIASLENRLKRIKGQCTEVTSREMLRSLSQAKTECWDRFLHDAQTALKAELVNTLEHLNAEELECLLLPSLSREQTSTDQSQSRPEAAAQNHEEDKSPIPEK
uniref:Coiled-coil domain containing 32 n=1 Tax=Oncorhynchus kisutch TaxID=8019 RepID=A0A8C7FV78_ONCKI